MLGAPCASVLIMTQPATINKRFSEAKLTPLRQYLKFDSLQVNYSYVEAVKELQNLGEACHENSNWRYLPFLTLTF
jgi:hypothetical protein